MVPITDMDQLYDNAVVFLIPATSSLVCSTNTPFPRVTATWNHTSVHELAVWIARLHSITIPTHRSGNTSSLSLAYTHCEDNHCKYHYTTKSRILEDTPPLVAVPHSTDLVDFEEHALLRPAFPTQHTHFRASEELHCCRHARSVAYQTFSAQKPGLQRRVHSSFALHRPWTMHSEGTENGLPSRLTANRLGPESGDSCTCSSIQETKKRYMNQNTATALGNHMLMLTRSSKSTTAGPKVRQTVFNGLQGEMMEFYPTGFSEDGSSLELRELVFVFGAFRSATRLLNPLFLFPFHTQSPSYMPSPPSPSSSSPIPTGLSIRANNDPPRK